MRERERFDFSDEFEEIRQYAHCSLYSREQMIYYSKTRPSFIHFLDSGKVKLLVYGDSKDEPLMTRLVEERGEVFGQEVISNIPYVFTAQAMEDTKVYKLGREEATYLARKNPDFRMKLLRQMIEEIAITDDTRWSYFFRDDTQRVGEQLLLRLNGREDGVVEVTRQEIADSIAVHKEYIKSNIRWLKRKGLISATRTEFKILDVDALMEFVNSPSGGEE